jgi:hypothetical protein
MTRYFAACPATAILMVVLDGLRVGVVAMPLTTPGNAW